VSAKKRVKYKYDKMSKNVRGTIREVHVETIFTRRSVRTYKDRYVEDEKVEQLLRAGMQAPSAGNQQPWEFIVVRDKEKLAELAAASPYAQCTAKAPLAIVLIINDKSLRFPDYVHQDMGACAQTVLLEAVNQGLGAVWLGIAPLKEREKAVSDVLNLSDNLRPFAIIPVGYPLKDDANHFTDRYDQLKVTLY